MAVSTHPAWVPPAIPHPTHTMSVCDYVDLPLDTVKDLFTDAGADALLNEALRAAFGIDGAVVSVHATPAEAVGRGMARVYATWEVTPPTGSPFSGSGTMIAVVVQSGREAQTELLVTIPVPDDVSTRQSAAVTHRFLDELTARLMKRVAA